MDTGIQPGMLHASKWVLLRSQWGQEQSRQLTRLYLDTGAGFSEETAIDLPVTDKGNLHEIVYISEEVRALRWVSITYGGELDLDRLHITRLGFLERNARMLRRIIPQYFKHSAARRRREGLTLRNILRNIPASYKSSGRLRQMPASWSIRRFKYWWWIRWREAISDRDVAAIMQRIRQMKSPPTITVLMPVYNPPITLLREAVESVRGQIYPHWELCIADDASSDVSVRNLLEEYSSTDRRIKVSFRESNGHISAASNTALHMASGLFCALLDHDDLLTPHALYWVAEEICKVPDTEIIYSDEDKIDEDGYRFDPYHKPDWNPQLALSQNCVSHLGAYRTSTIRRIGGFRSGYEGSQDYDLMLRVTDAVPAERIRHIPAVLYHWRARFGSTALANTEKDYAWDAGRRAIEDHFARNGVDAEVSRAQSRTFYRVTYKLNKQSPRVSIIIPTKDKVELLQRCIDSLVTRSTYKNYEVLVVDNGSAETAAVDYLKRLRSQNVVRVLSYSLPFNYSAMNNLAAAEAEGDVLCLLNNDTEVITVNWMEEMLGCLMQPKVGVVGARLLFQNNTIQHAGIVLAGRERIAMHAHAFLPSNQRGYVGRACLAQDYSAVTGACMMIRRSLFMHLDGLNEVDLPVAFNDVDLCMRAREQGWRVVYTPYAELYHHEKATRGGNRDINRQRAFEQEKAYMRNRWGEMLDRDPFYSPNHDFSPPGFTLTSKPRVLRPWME